MLTAPTLPARPVRPGVRPGLRGCRPGDYRRPVAAIKRRGLAGFRVMAGGRPGLHPDGGGKGGADDRGVRRGALLVLEFAIRGTVGRRPRLLPPAVGERSGVVRPVADRVEKLEDGNLRPGMVS